MTASRFPAGRISIVAPRVPMSMDEAVANVKRVEAAGFECIWAGTGDATNDAFPVLAVYARHTERIKLGTAIVSWTRTPPTMEASAATVNEISGGRFVLGLGTMPKARNENWHNIDASHLVGRMREYVEVIPGLQQPRDVGHGQHGLVGVMNDSCGHDRIERSRTKRTVQVVCQNVEGVCGLAAECHAVVRSQEVKQVELFLCERYGLIFESHRALLW